MQETIDVNIENLRFNCRVTGDKKNDLIILLHGFPETSYMWRNLMKDLSDTGFYCVAPNLRGFSIGACPKNKKSYHLDKLVNDVIQISKHFGRTKFHLVGHDWGAAIGWKLAYDNQEAILSWTAISIPHLQAFGNAIVNDPEQQKMSQYIKAFQWPFLPEIRIRKNDFELFRNLWKNSKPDEVENYLKVFRNRKQLTATLNYYRGNYKVLKKASNDQILGDIHVPTLFIWGNRDMAIGLAAVKNSHQYMKNDYEFLELDAGHWLIQTNYTDLKNSIKKHIGKHKQQRP
ncbi:MAG: alpha/beta hydrolase [Christiangramia sp.]